MPRNINLVRRSNQRGERPRVDRQRTPSPERPERERKPIPSGPDAGKLYVQKSAIDEEYWLPAAGSVLKFLFSFRVSAAVWSGISDCDETFNYWEPLHMFLFGDGFQTWEYSPVYAIRSYWYIYLHYMPATFLKTIFQSKVHLFIGIRIVLASLCMFAEYTLYRTLCNRISISIGRMFIFLSAVSAGMFISSAAFLPSSFSMVMNMLALAAYLNEKWFTAVFFTCFSAFVGWPFAAILGLPIALDMLLLRDGQTRMRFFIYSSVSAFLVGGSMIYCDSHYFGKLVFAPLNIVLYNVFSDRGPELYGIEPASYYAKNMLLNWNVAAPLCLIALPLAGIVYSQSFPAASSHRYRGLPVTLSYWRRLMPLALIYCSMILWILIFFSTPHKEERFLFPIYPLIALFASVTIDAICRMFEHFAGPKASWPNATYLILAVFFVISMSRAVALYRNYSGSMETYRSFNEHFIVDHSTLDFSKRSQEPLRLCVGKEWYRFPSSFFLPQEVSDHFGRKRGVELRFLRSEFRGQLPKPWLKGRLPHVTRTVPTTMNDENREEIDRYVPLESCDYLIDLEVRGSTEFEPRYGEKKFLERMHTHQFLEPSKSHPVLRAFFVPYFNDRFNRYVDYTLFRRTSPSIKR